MSKPSRDPSIEHEPQFSGLPVESDPTEERARRSLERVRRDDGAAGADSIFDEPDIFPGRAAEIIDRDWHCSVCGYNLRGLVTGDRCPECGHVELYRPAPAESLSLANRNQQRALGVSARLSAFAIIAAALCGGPWAVLGTFLSYRPAFLMSVVVGPVTEEVMKLAAIIMLIELRPYFIRNAEQIRVAAVVSALGFALIENLLYLYVYVSQPSFALIAWRWIVCSSLHLGCSWYASGGLVESWRSAMETGSPDRLSSAYRRLIVAIAIHGAFNFTVTMMAYAGITF